MANQDSQQTGRRPGLRPVARALPRLTGAALRRRGFVEAALAQDWASIIGTEIAEWCVPVRLVFPRDARRGGVLHLRADSARAIEIRHLEPRLLERINGVFGYGAVARLAIRQGVVRPRGRRRTRALRPVAAEQAGRIEQGTAAIEDPGLRAALERLGRTIAAGSP